MRLCGFFFFLILFVAFAGSYALLILFVDDGLSEGLDDQFNALKGIVVASNDILNRIGITVSIDKSHNGYAQLIGFSNSKVFFAWVNDNDQPWGLTHTANT